MHLVFVLVWIDSESEYLVLLVKKRYLLSGNTEDVTNPNVDTKYSA